MRVAVFLVALVAFLSIESTCYSQNAWKQKAKYPGGARAYDAEFTIGHYAFVGTGYTGTELYDFWKWDQTTNTWSAIANYPGAGGLNCTSFSIEGKGYVGLGWTGGNGATDLWRYDTITSSWTQMATFPGVGRYDCEVFVIGHKAYCIGGSIAGPPYLNDFWVYDAHTNTWKQLKNYPGGQVEENITFAIGNHGYAGDGWFPGCNFQMYEYDTTNDSWATLPNIPATYGITEQPDSWVSGSKAYLATGGYCSAAGLRDGWMYDTVTKSWCEFTSMASAKLARGNGVVFTIKNKGYICTGQDTNLNYLGDLWEYDPSTKILVADTNICSTDSVHYSDSSSYLVTNWNWSFPGGNPATSTLPNPSVIYSSAGTYTVELIVIACGDVDTVIRKVQVINGASSPIILGGNTAICTGQIDTLIATGGSSYIWSTGATSSSIIVNPASNITYSVQIINGTCKKDTSIAITVGSKLIITISGNDTICTGSAVTLNSSGGKGYSYLWNTGATTSDITISPSANTSYSVQVSNGVCSGDTTFNIDVIPQPGLTALATKTSICLGDATTLTASGSNNYLWSNGNTSSSITVSPTTSTNYSVLTSNGKCTKDTSIKITVNTTPTAIVSGPQTICYGSNAIINASGGQKYIWLPGTGLNCDTCATVLADPPSSTTYTLVALNGNCTDSATSKVTVGQTPNGKVCCDDTIQMGETTTLVTMGNGAGTYQWFPASSLNCSTCPLVIAFPNLSTTYTVIMTDSDGCSKTDTVRVFVEGCNTVWIPNAFTPNADGVNDFFAPKGICMISYSMYIFDKWGEIIYRTDNSQPWDGRGKKDVVVKDDTYVYVITVTDGFLMQTKYIGRVTVIN